MSENKTIKQKLFRSTKVARLARQTSIPMVDGTMRPSNSQYRVEHNYIIKYHEQGRPGERTTCCHKEEAMSEAPSTSPVGGKALSQVRHLADCGNLVDNYSTAKAVLIPNLPQY